jgi:hypothetical protein
MSAVGATNFACWTITGDTASVAPALMVPENGIDDGMV